MKKRIITCAILCICIIISSGCKKEEKQLLIQSPMNYLGGKFKLLKQILPEFPQNIDNFIDLFAGGGNVGINISANRIILNDNNQSLYGIYNLFKNKDKNEIFASIQEIIERFALSESSKYGYDYYSCQSNTGLQEYNKAGYTKLREYFNSKKVKDEEVFLC